MVAPTKAAARPGATNAAAADAKVQKDLDLAAAKGPHLDQVAAAAVVDAADQVIAQAGFGEGGAPVDAAADVLAASGVMPTEAPVADDGIGLLAQAPAPAATDATTTAPAPSEPPPTEEADKAAINPWVAGGAALVGVGVIAAVASSDDDNNSPPPPPPPPPPPGGGETPAPTPTPNAAPTGADKTVPLDVDGKTAMGGLTFNDTDGDTLTGIKITGITVGEAPADTATSNFEKVGNSIYELVEVGAPGISWAAAKAAAEAKGGTLAILDTPEEMAAVKAAFLGDFSGDPGVVDFDGDIANTAYIGLSQAAGSTEPGGGWTWLNGTAFSGTSPLWNDSPQQPDNTGGDENFGSLWDGTSNDSTKLVLDVPGTGGFRYLIEYDSATTSALTTAGGATVGVGSTVAAADIATLEWNSLFNTGGTVTYELIASAGTQQTQSYTVTFGAGAGAGGIGSLIDPDVNLLA